VSQTGFENLDAFLKNTIFTTRPIPIHSWISRRQALPPPTDSRRSMRNTGCISCGSPYRMCVTGWQPRISWRTVSSLIGRIIRQRSVPAYILTAVKNRCLNWLETYRRQSQVQHNIHSTAYRLAIQSLASCEADESQSLLMTEVGAIIRHELERMPERTRRIFVAHRYEDMSYREIAALYELSEGQVQYEIRSAKQALKIALKDYIPAIMLLFLSWHP